MTERSHILPEHDVRPYSVAQLAERWGCSGNVVRKLINHGELRFFRIGSLIRIPAAEVQRYEALPATPAEQASSHPPIEPGAPSKKRQIPRKPRKKIQPNKGGIDDCRPSA